MRATGSRGIDQDENTPEGTLALLASRQVKAGKAVAALGFLVLLGGIGSGAVLLNTDDVGHSPPPEGLPAALPESVLACAACHLNPGLQPSYRDEAGRLHQGYIDADAYVGSIHFRRDMRECTDCHQGDYSRFPHPAGNPEPSCHDCHEDFEEEYSDIQAAVAASVHKSGSAAGAFDCATCHSPHTMVPAREMTVREKNAGCVECHEKRYNPTGLTLEQRHAWHPQAALHLERVACIACHTRPSGTDFSFRHNIRPSSEATSDCYACHSADTKMAAYEGSFFGGRPQVYTRTQLVRAYYMSGGTRSASVDRLGLALLLLVVLGTATHGALRFVLGRRKRV
jgi:predicted CXXCH cytochrome family protein